MNRFSTTEVAPEALHEVHMQHLDEGTIHAWLDDALAGDEAASVAKHVDECRECAALVAEARGMIVAAGNIVAALDNVRGGVIPAPAPSPAPARASGQGSLWRRLHFTPTRAALAATVLIAIGSVLTVRYGRPGADRRVRPANVMSDAAPSTLAPSAVVPSAPVTPPSATPSISATSPAAEPSRPARRPLVERAAKPSTPPSTPPSNKLADARQAADSARPIAADRLMSAAAPSASTNAPANAASVRGAGVQQAKASAADSTRATAPEQRRAEVIALQEVVTTGTTSKRLFAQAGAVDACYQVRIDSASPAVASGILPRFALGRNAATTQNVVRSVTPQGRIDSIVPGGSWESPTPNVVRVRFAATREDQPFTLQLDGGRLTGRSGAGDQAMNLPVTRIDCRR